MTLALTPRQAISLDAAVNYHSLTAPPMRPCPCTPPIRPIHALETQALIPLTSSLQRLQLPRMPTEQTVPRLAPARPMLVRPAPVLARAPLAAAHDRVDVAHLALLDVEHALQRFRARGGDFAVAREVGPEGGVGEDVLL